MLKLTTSLLCIALSLLVSSSVMAKDTNSGEVTKVDAAKKELTISTESDCCGGRIIEITFTLTDKTKVTLDGNSKKLSDLKSGDRVEVDYEDLEDVQKVAARRDK